jgi:hypothetical protein
VFGTEHLGTLSNMNNLAFTLKGLRRNTEAIRLMEECVQLGERILGVDHPCTCSSRMALTLWERENFDPCPRASGASMQ